MQKPVILLLCILTFGLCSRTFRSPQDARDYSAAQYANKFQSQVFKAISLNDKAQLVKILHGISRSLNRSKILASWAYDALTTSIFKGFDDISLVLIDATILNHKANRNEAIVEASTLGQIKVVERLLKDREVDPSVMDQLPLKLACERGYPEIVQLLLRHPKIDPTLSNYSAYEHAHNANQAEVVQVFLDDGRIDGAHLSNMLNRSLTYGDNATAKILLHHLIHVLGYTHLKLHALRKSIEAKNIEMVQFAASQISDEAVQALETCFDYGHDGMTKHVLMELENKINWAIYGGNFLLRAIKSKDTEGFCMMLGKSGYKPHPDTLFEAVKIDDHDIVELVLKRFSAGPNAINPADGNNRSIKLACRQVFFGAGIKGNFDVFKALIANKSVNSTVNYRELLALAKGSSSEICEYILTNMPNSDSQASSDLNRLNNAIEASMRDVQKCGLALLKMMDRILSRLNNRGYTVLASNKYQSLISFYPELLQYSKKRGDYETAMFILKQDESIDPAASTALKAFKKAENEWSAGDRKYFSRSLASCYHAYTELVELGYRTLADKLAERMSIFQSVFNQNGIPLEVFLNHVLPNFNL